MNQEKSQGFILEKGGFMISNLRLAKRDLDILNFINKNGFTSISVVSSMAYSQNKEPEKDAHRRLLAMEKNGLVESTFFGSRGKKLYLLTRSGYEELENRGNELINRLTKPQITNVEHDLLVQEICGRVIQMQSEILDNFMPERQIMTQFKGSFYPDAAFILRNQQKIALEVEIVQKREDRLYRKLNYYEDDPYYAHVVYLCGNQNIKRKLSSYIKRGKFSAYTLKEMGKDQNIVSDRIFSLIRQRGGLNQ